MKTTTRTLTLGRHDSSLRHAVARRTLMPRFLMVTVMMISMMTGGVVRGFAQDEVVFSWESQNGTVSCEGGSVSYVNGEGNNKINLKQNNYYTIKVDGKWSNLNDAKSSTDAGHIDISLNSPLQEGDKITLTGFISKNTAANASLYMLCEKGNIFNGTEGDSYWPNIYSGGEPKDFTWTVIAKEEGSKKITLTRAKTGTALYFTKILITRKSTEGNKVTINYKKRVEGKLVDATSSEVGTVDADGNKYAPKKDVTMTATPTHSYKFAEWRNADGANTVSYKNPYTFAMPNQDVQYTAVFEECEMIELTKTITVDGTANDKIGTIAVKNKNGDDSNATHPADEELTVTAPEKTGYLFDHWTLTTSDGQKEEFKSKEWTFTMPAKKATLTACFQSMYCVKFNKDDADGVAPDAVYAAKDGKTKITIPANRTLFKQGYTLTEWSDGTKSYKIGDVVQPVSDIELTPIFTKNAIKQSELEDAVTVTWDFSYDNGAPVVKYEGNNDKGFIVAQAVINGITQDFKLGIDASESGSKFEIKKANPDKAQVKDGIVFTMESDRNAIVKIYATSNNKLKTGEDGTKVDGKPLASGPEGTESPYLYTSQRAGNGNSIDVNVVTVDNEVYMTAISITFPPLPKIRTVRVITSDPLAGLPEGQEKAENAGNVEMAGEGRITFDNVAGFFYDTKVTITATANYGYYISAFKDEKGRTLKESTDKSDKAQLTHTVTGDATITVEFKRHPMAKVCLETADKTQGKVDFVKDYIHPNFYVDESESGTSVWSYFRTEDKVKLTYSPSEGYVIDKWTIGTADGTVIEDEGKTVSDPIISVPATEGKTATYFAHFLKGEKGSVHFKLRDTDNTWAALKLKNDGTYEKKFALDKEAGAEPESITPDSEEDCTSFYIPEYYTIFTTYDYQTEKGYTLKYWVNEKDYTQKYQLGNTYSFKAGETDITLIPVFIENPAGMMTRLNEPVITLDFTRKAHAQKVNIKKRAKSFYWTAKADIEAIEQGVVLPHTRDVAAWISTGEKGYIRNTDMQEWVAFGPGTRFEVASCKDAVIKILTYAPITTTTIDGVVPTEYEKVGDHEYIYSYKTENPSPRLPIVIGDDHSYYKWIKVETRKASRVTLHASVNDSGAGEITNTDVVNNEVEDPIYEIVDKHGKGYSVHQGNEVKITLKRKFGNKLKDLVEVSHEPVGTRPMDNDEAFPVLKDLSYTWDWDNPAACKGTVEMIDKETDTYRTVTLSSKSVKVKDSNGNDVERDCLETDDSGNDNVFKLRIFEPTEEEMKKKINAEHDTICTKYEVSFSITTDRHLEFRFEPKPTYYITYTQGQNASGTVPVSEWIEEGDLHAIPQNTTLYWVGHTLKHWVDETGNKYQRGEIYHAPGKDLRLTPVFEENGFTILDDDLKDTNGYTATWNFSKSLGASDIYFERSRGILVTQIYKDKTNDPTNFIDVCISLDATNGKFHNKNGMCQINKGSIISLPVTKGCRIKLSANSQINITEIAGKTGADNDDATHYAKGQTVSTTWSGEEGTQSIVFKGSDGKTASDGKNYDCLSVTYYHQDIKKPELQSVTFNGTPISVEKLAELKEKKKITIDTCPITLDAYGILVSESIGVTSAEPAALVKIDQASIERPYAIINLYSKAEDGSLLASYNVNFNLTAPDPVDGKGDTPKFLYMEINNVKYTEDKVADIRNITVEDVAVSGTVKFVFDRTMKSIETSTPENFKLTGGKEMTVNYWNRPESSEGGDDIDITNFKDKDGNLTKFTDIYGKECKNPPLTVKYFTHKAESDIVKKQFDYIVGEDGSLSEIIDKVNADTGNERIYIFVPDGEHELKGNEPLKSSGEVNCDEDGNPYAVNKKDMNNRMTKLSRANVSLIGQSRDGVTVWNHPLIEGLANTATIHLGKNSTGAHPADFYCEELTLENRFDYHKSMENQQKRLEELKKLNPNFSAAARAAVFRDEGQRTILKDVALKSWQDTYKSDNSSADYRAYFENCQIAGNVDFICGNGNVWFERCDIIVRDKNGPNVTAPAQEAAQDWGYVFNDCSIMREAGYDYQNEIEGQWTLGRPWGDRDDENKSPACTFINTKLSTSPIAYGWGVFIGGSRLRFHEYGTKGKGGAPVSLAARSLAACNPAAGSDECVMTQTDAERYTIQNVMGGSDAFSPDILCKQIDAISDMTDSKDQYNSLEWDDQIGIEDDRLHWNEAKTALCYFVFKMEDDRWVYKENTTETNINLERPGYGIGTYYVRAANQRGGLGAPTKCLQYDGARKFTLYVKKVGSYEIDGKPAGWSTICLPENAKVPEGLKAYAATPHTSTDKITDYYMNLTEVNVINKNQGYIVYGPVNADGYVFISTSHSSQEPTILSGNPTDHAISAINNNCYVMSYKTYGLGFYKYTGSELPPYCAWLPADMVENDVQVGVASEAKAIRFILNDETTGIDGAILNGINTDADSDQLYNLSGQRVKTPAANGIYITRGKGKILKRR